MNYGRHKKIRGGKRHLKRLAQQSLSAAPLSKEMLHLYGYDYNKLGLGVWHWHHRQPPQGVRQLAAQHLLTTLLAWQQQLQTQPEPFYLAIWLVHSPEFAHSSQVVAGLGERRARYGGMFGAPDLAGPSLLPEYRQLPGAEALTWATHPWYTTLDEFDYPGGWPAWTLTKPHYVQHFEDSGNYLMAQTGWVWVGQLA